MIEAAPPALAVRIATFNVESLGDAMDGGATLEERIALLRPQLLRLRADILCLQEVDGQHPADGGERRLLALEALVAGTPYAGFARVSTVSRRGGGVRDRHNLVILSRFPVEAEEQILHDLVAPPSHRVVTGDKAAATAIEWDRPLLYAAVRLTPARLLHVLNLHLRAPRAAFVAGQKVSSRQWRTMAGWAEGFFVAAVKRAGQALEARLVVDRLLAADAEAWIAVCGDFNADTHETPVRTIRGDEEDAGNPHLAMTTLVPVERGVADSRRFSVVHHGRPQMLDHVLVSRPLLSWFRGVEIHNEALGDELMSPGAVPGAPASYHAPVVAEFRIAAGDARPPGAATG
jgi:endonuclease/exonuclease/phosphatase family metal-dependent hydrolase